MPVMTASQHARAVLLEIDKVQALSVDNRNRIKYVLYGLFKAARRFCRRNKGEDKRS